MSDAKLPDEPTLTLGELFALGGSLLVDKRFCRACDGDGFIGNRDCGGCKGQGEVFSCSGPTRQFIAEAMVRFARSDGLKAATDTQTERGEG